MWGIAGKKGNTRGTEDAVQLLSNSLLNEEQLSSQGVIGHGYPAGLSHQQVLGRHTSASGMVWMCLARNQSSSCVLADASQRAEWDRRVLSLLQAGSEQLLYARAHLPQQSCGARLADLKKNENVSYSSTDDKLSSTSFTSHWKL